MRWTGFKEQQNRRCKWLAQPDVKLGYNTAMSKAKTKAWLAWFAMKLRPCLPRGVLDSFLQWFRRFVPDPDFEIFAGLEDVDGLCLDIGANRGHSAISVLRQTRRMRVLSVEPNKTYRWSLILICLLHPWRFRFRLFAAVDETAQQVLHIPGVRNSGLGTQASLDASEFGRSHICERLAEAGFDALDETAYRRLTVKVAPMDALKLSPDIVKIDVEGFEQQALTGMGETLGRCLPALLIELNHPHRWMPFLKELGYSFYFYDTSSGSLKVFRQTPGLVNLFCLHQANQSEITRKLLQKITT